MRSEWVVPATQAANPSLRDVMNGAFIPTCCTVMSREIYDRCRGSNEDLPRCEDQYLFLLAREHGTFRYVPEVLARYHFVFTRQKARLWLESARTYDRLVAVRYGIHGVGSGPLVTIGLVHIALGDRKRARECFTEALRMRPIAPKTWVRLAWVCLPNLLSRPLRSVMPARVRKALDGPPNGLWECVAP